MEAPDGSAMWSARPRTVLGANSIGSGVQAWRFFPKRQAKAYGLPARLWNNTLRAARPQIELLSAAVRYLYFGPNTSAG